jgi:hypothetical protein
MASFSVWDIVNQSPCPANNCSMMLLQHWQQDPNRPILALAHAIQGYSS